MLVLGIPLSSLSFLPNPLKQNPNLSCLRRRWFLWPSSGANLFSLFFVYVLLKLGFWTPPQISFLVVIDPLVWLVWWKHWCDDDVRSEGMSTESACGWSVPSLTGNLSIDLSVPRLWRREGLNRHQSSLMLAQIDGVFCLFFLEARVPARSLSGA